MCVRPPQTKHVPIQDPPHGQGGPSIQLFYQSGWNRVFMHCNIDGKGRLHLTTASWLPGIALHHLQCVLSCASQDCMILLP